MAIITIPQKTPTLLLISLVVCMSVSCNTKPEKAQTAKAIFMKYINANGGETAMRKIKTFYNVEDSKINRVETFTSSVYIRCPANRIGCAAAPGRIQEGIFFLNQP